MTLKDAIDALVLAVSTDATVAAYCTEQFGQGPFVFRGVDPAEPPGQAFAPCIAITTGGRGRSQDYHRKLHELQLTVGIVAGPPTTAGNVISYPGVDLINEFADLVERVATVSLLESGVVSTLQVGEPDQVLAPWHLATWSYMVEIDDRLE